MSVLRKGTFKKPTPSAHTRNSLACYCQVTCSVHHFRVSVTVLHFAGKNMNCYLDMFQLNRKLSSSVSVSVFIYRFSIACPFSIYSTYLSIHQSVHPPVSVCVCLCHYTSLAINSLACSRIDVLRPWRIRTPPASSG